MGRTSGSYSKSRPHSASSSRRAKFNGRSPATPRGGGGGGGSADCRVFVGNLRYETSWQLLKDHMRSAGNVVHADILSGPDGRSKGCGIVEYASSSDAQRAIRDLNETTLDGRTIFLREDRESGGGDRGGSGCTVFVGNLSWDSKWQDLKDHMREAGNVAHVEILENRDGRSKGCGIVEYEDSAGASRALRDLDGTTLMGRELFVQPDERDGGGGGDGGKRSGGGGTHTRSHHDERDCRVFVGNLSYETSWQTLKDFMRKAGNVARADILEGPDGRSKGCGIVEYEDPRGADRARRELNEGTLGGRTVYVQEDRGPNDGDGGNRGGGGGGGRGGGEDDCQLYVGNLSWETKWQDLKDHFKQCGDVQRAEVMEGSDGRSKGYGTIRFFNARDADKAIQRLDGTDLDGRTIHVRLDQKV